MSFQKEVSNALSYITANGYQIHPEAFKVLKNLNSNIMDIIQKVVRLKKTQSDDNNIILIEDFRNFCTINISTEYDSLTAADSSIKISHTTLKKNNEIQEFKTISTQKNIANKSSTYNESFKIIYDSTDYIDPEEGVDGYISLFKSRFSKTLRILSSRPESKRINKISFVKRRIKQKIIITIQKIIFHQMDIHP